VVLRVVYRVVRVVLSETSSADSVSPSDGGLDSGGIADVSPWWRPFLHPAVFVGVGILVIDALLVAFVVVTGGEGWRVALRVLGLH
jgi:hypothetical protein